VPSGLFEQAVATGPLLCRSACGQPGRVALPWSATSRLPCRKRRRSSRLPRRCARSPRRWRRHPQQICARKLARRDVGHAEERLEFIALGLAEFIRASRSPEARMNNPIRWAASLRASRPAPGQQGLSMCLHRRPRRSNGFIVRQPGAARSIAAIESSNGRAHDLGDRPPRPAVRTLGGRGNHFC
jgi:hypothetical protein